MATAAYKGRFDINERAPEPRYVAIKQYVLHAISSGELKPGDRLQSEAELVQQFGVSRMTASRALRELQNAGIIVRLTGVGRSEEHTSELQSQLSISYAVVCLNKKTNTT